MSRIYPYAGFWRRAVALMIDSIILSIPAVLLYALIMLSITLGLASRQNALSQSGDASLAGALAVVGGTFFFQVAFFVLFWLYFAFMESGKKQATFGKRVMGIKVVGANGERISFARATGRFFGKYVSGLILNFGYCMAGFTKKRQALHDLMAETYVVQADFLPGQEKPELAFSVGGLVASIVVAVAPFVFFFAALLLGVLFVAGAEAASDSPSSVEEIKRRMYVTQAKAQMFSLSLDNKTKLPMTEHNISYSKTSDGYRAEFTDTEGNRFVLLNKNGGYDACCAEGNCELIDEEKCN